MKALWVLFIWNWNGARIPDDEREWFKSKWVYAGHIWTIHMSLAAVKMQHGYTIDEIIDELENE